MAVRLFECRYHISKRRLAEIYRTYPRTCRGEARRNRSAYVTCRPSDDDPFVFQRGILRRWWTLACGLVSRTTPDPGLHSIT